MIYPESSSMCMFICSMVLGCQTMLCLDMTKCMMVVCLIVEENEGGYHIVIKMYDVIIYHMRSTCIQVDTAL